MPSGSTVWWRELFPAMRMHYLKPSIAAKSSSHKKMVNCKHYGNLLSPFSGSPFPHPAQPQAAAP